MVKRIGKIITVNKESNKVYILEIGPKGEILESQLDQVTCSDDDQFPQYPARIQNRIAQYEISKGIVTKVQVMNLENGFRTPFCRECQQRYTAFTMAAKICVCGNMTNSMFRHCEVCAFRQNKCVMCGNPLS